MKISSEHTAGCNAKSGRDCFCSPSPKAGAMNFFYLLIAFGFGFALALLLVAKEGEAIDQKKSQGGENGEFN